MNKKILPKHETTLICITKKTIIPHSTTSKQIALRVICPICTQTNTSHLTIIHRNVLCHRFSNLTALHICKFIKFHTCNANTAHTHRRMASKKITQSSRAITSLTQQAPSPGGAQADQAPQVRVAVKVVVSGDLAADCVYLSAARQTSVCVCVSVYIWGD